MVQVGGAYARVRESRSACPPLPTAARWGSRSSRAASTHAVPRRGAAVRAHQAWTSSTTQPASRIAG